MAKKTAAKTGNRVVKVFEMYAYPYLKQGDGWKIALDECKGDVVKALRFWADQIEESVKGLRSLATYLDGKKGLKGRGMTHSAEIDGIDDIDAALKASPGVGDVHEMEVEDEE